MEETHIALEGVNKEFPTSGQVLKNIHLKISEGDFVALLGPSGSGKSTILRLIANLESLSSGQLHIRKSLQKYDRAYVFQEAHLMPWRTVLNNVALPLELMGVGKNERQKEAQKALEDVGLGDAASLFPRELSGGMKMRASLARALVIKPQLLLLDEPFAALDENTRFHLAEELRKLWIKRRMTVVFVTHSVSEATFLANRAVVLTSKPAQIFADIKISLPEERHTDLRTQDIYTHEMQKIYAAFNKANPRGVER